MMTNVLSGSDCDSFKKSPAFLISEIPEANKIKSLIPYFDVNLVPREASHFFTSTPFGKYTVSIL